ncbi:hypothetical protein F4780DRAFT_628417 [Xylariomycetidae sp. FL0641]|nr:hypothetical protein F4780DRAFT_628417 [Xylariomycetidae sp. FL0641]
MLATMYSPTFNFEYSSPHRPAVASPLSSSPLRPSHDSSMPLSPRDTNTLPRREIQSSPSKPPSSKFKFAARNPRPNPLRQSRENTQEGRRKLFLKNVRQRADDKAWERRGGDQDVLKLEWATLNRQWRQQKDADLDGVVFEHELEDIPETSQEPLSRDSDDVMVDAIARDEERELDAMLSLLEPASFEAQEQPDSPSLSDDDDYDSLFQDYLSEQEQCRQDPTFSGQMDLS